MIRRVWRLLKRKLNRRKLVVNRGSEWCKAMLPRVVLQSDEAVAVLQGLPAFRVRWDDIQIVEIDVVVIDEPALQYSEAFWDVNNGEFGAPVEMVAGAEAMRERFMALPRFDVSALDAALEAEQTMTAGRFVCWRRNLDGNQSTITNHQ